MNKTFLNTFGWYGAVATLAAYAFITMGIFNAGNLWYQILNFTGAIGLTSIASYKKDYQLIVVNAVWALIACIGLIQIIWR